VRLAADASSKGKSSTAVCLYNLRQLTRAEDIALEKRAASSAERTRRDPAVLADLLLSPIGGLSAVSRLRP